MIVTAVVLSAFLRVPADAAQLQNPPIDGRNPQAQLIGDSSGAFYGTTVYGGDRRCEKGCGTVYKLTPSGSRYRETIL
ncbi:MAG TPA: choice-of-anchor tandem repeat GloVer-containing protein, partial [Candidatus Eremiobacteraceae bacterium]